MYGMVWYGMVWCGVVWCGVVWCGMVWYVPCASPKSLGLNSATQNSLENSSPATTKYLTLRSPNLCVTFFCRLANTVRNGL